jgi:hypothetical protein
MQRLFYSHEELLKLNRLKTRTTKDRCFTPQEDNAKLKKTVG